MKRTTRYFLLIACVALLSACNKVSPLGVLIGGSGVEDRVKMSIQFFKNYEIQHFSDIYVDGPYSFLVGSDSHLTTDAGRLEEMFKIALDNDDVLMAHLGDIADTKAEYYIMLDSVMRWAKLDYVFKYYDWHYFDTLVPVDTTGAKANYDLLYFTKKEGDHEIKTYDDIQYPFYPVVGNHDITHNGWALWSNIFGSSFYEINVVDTVNKAVDHFVFLDSANGTLGREQINAIEDGILDEEGKFAAGAEYEGYGSNYRYVFCFTHTNIFRPSSFQFASTFSREETYFLLDLFSEWQASIVFMGHVHAWDERQYGNAYYLTVDCMSESNNPEPGDYLVRVNVDDSDYDYEKVHMSYTPKK